MSKVAAMLAASQLRPPRVPPPPPPAPLFRWVRSGARRATWRPWWLAGLVEVVTYPEPRFRTRTMVLLPGVRAFESMPAIAPRWVAAT
jgi:hypothetical protein